MIITRIALLGLAALGAVRWGSLLTSPEYLRLLAPLLLGVALVALWRGRARTLRWLIGLIAVVLTLPLAGVPLGWLTGLRIARIGQLIGDGLGAIPGALVPVLDGGPLRTVIVLGAGLLAMCSAVLFARAREETLRSRALAAGPLLVMLVVPDTLVPSGSPYLEGVVVLVLLAAIAWGPRLRRPAAAGLVVLAAGVAALLAPTVRPTRPWVDVRQLAGSIGSTGGEQFDFNQGFGPLNWAHDDRILFTVTSQRAAYWKAVDLDTFDGRGFTAAARPAGLLPAPSPPALGDGTLNVTIHDLALHTSQLVAPGYALDAEGIPGRVTAGAAPGTFTVTPPLQPGAHYSLTAYAPQPTAAELVDSGDDGDPGGLEPYRTINLPQGPAVSFPAFRETSGAAAYALSGSPYDRAYALAQSLSRSAPTSYAFVRAVMAHLSHGFTYDQHPPNSNLPLLDFLFGSRRGYCQQFAGAMALLLRMGGVPARVVGGFTPGTYDSTHNRWLVPDSDAHDWVEVWFDQWGWVTFDPTPAVDPAIAGSVSVPGVAFTSGVRTAQNEHRRTAAARAQRPPPAQRPTPAGPAAQSGAHASGATGAAPLLGIVILATLVLAGLGLRHRSRPRRRPGDEPGAELVDELERAMRRTGRPLGGGLTLAALERRFAGHDGAVRYLRAVRDARFAGRATPPSPADRRALRAALAHGLGPAGRLRAWYALPPRRASNLPERRRRTPTLRR